MVFKHIIEFVTCSLLIYTYIYTSILLPRHEDNFLFFFFRVGRTYRVLHLNMGTCTPGIIPSIYIVLGLAIIYALESAH